MLPGWKRISYSEKLRKARMTGDLGRQRAMLQRPGKVRQKRLGLGDLIRAVLLVNSFMVKNCFSLLTPSGFRSECLVLSQFYLADFQHSSLLLLFSWSLLSFPYVNFCFCISLTFVEVIVLTMPGGLSCCAFQFS